MLDKSIVEKVLLWAAETGADFAELFAEQGGLMLQPQDWKAVRVSACLKVI